MSVLRAALPGWPDNIQIFYSTRTQGVSRAPYTSLNIAAHVGDRPAAVADNRRLLEGVLPKDTRISWLSQVHGATVVEASSRAVGVAEADAQWTAAERVACAIMTADCLPILLADRQGQVVAAVHAGWRGLQSGVIQAAVAAMPVPAASLLAWLGPAIGPDFFEVGGEVQAGCLASIGVPAGRYFRPSEARPERFMADLRGLATLVLKELGVACVIGDDACTYRDAQRFFSYRRDGVTGRMVNLVLRSAR